jgi:nucleoside-diphosphate-sugar epimerase
MPEGHILVTGATGLVGRSCMQHFAQNGYKTTAVSRRMPFTTYGASFMSVDLSSLSACQSAFATMTDITQIVFAALHEEPDLVSGWTSQAHVDRNELMLRNCVEAIAQQNRGLRNVTILQGPKAYGVHVHPVRPGAREDRDEDRSIPNFYWAQMDYLAERQKGESWGWTVLRPALVIGMAVGGAMNLIATLGVYGAVLKSRGEKFHFPGARETGMYQVTDTDLIARCCEWAGQSRKAFNQTFNITNGEFMSLKDYWPLIAECLGMEAGEDRPFKFAKELPGMSEEWDEIRQKNGLIAPDLGTYLGQSGQFSDFVCARAPGNASAMSCIKVRQAGFNDTLYCDEMLRKWFKLYQEDRLLPRVTETAML